MEVYRFYQDCTSIFFILEQELPSFSRHREDPGVVWAIVCTKKIVEINADRGHIYSEDGWKCSVSLHSFDIYNPSFQS